MKPRPTVRQAVGLAAAAVLLIVGTPGIVTDRVSVLGLVRILAALVLGGVLVHWHAVRTTVGAATDALLESTLAGLVIGYLLWAVLIDEPSAPTGVSPAAVGATLALLVLLVLIGRVGRPAPGIPWFGLALIVGVGLLSVTASVDSVASDEAPRFAVPWLLGAVATIVAMARLTLDPDVPHPQRALRALGTGPVLLALVGVAAGPVAALLQTEVHGEVSIRTVVVGTTVFPLLVIFYLFRQVHERARGEFLAHHDQLTELPTRPLFLDRLDVAIARARRRGGRLAVLFVDLDRFKEVNDSYGHDVGDLLLQIVARRLQDNLREEDTVSRIGGDEFTVLLPEVADEHDARSVADKLLVALRQPVIADGRELFPSASIGSAVYPADGVMAATLLENADRSMYQAKALGRSRIQAYSDELSVRAQLRTALESGLIAALDSGGLTIALQPKVDVLDNLVVGFEALARWTHPTLGPIPPSVFIPIAEETGMILEVGGHLLRVTCDLLARWREDRLVELPVALNVAARQVSTAALERPIADALARTGLPPRLLEIELAEEVLSVDPETVVRILTRLRDMGVRCLVDDFGTGNAGISHLARLPIDGVKLDRTFVAGLEHDPVAAPTALAVLALANSLELRVVAEGVETQQQHRWLREHGCRLMQGNLLCPPLPAEDLEARLIELRLVRGRDSSVPLRVQDITPTAPPTGGPDPLVTAVLEAARGGTLVDIRAAERVLTALQEGPTAG